MRAWLKPASSFNRLSLFCSMSLFSSSIVFKLLSIDVIYKTQAHSHTDSWQCCNCSLNPNWPSLLCERGHSGAEIQALFLRMDITSPQNSHNKAVVCSEPMDLAAGSHWITALAKHHGWRSMEMSSGKEGSVLSWDRECGLRGGGRKEKGGWCLHCCPALTAPLLINHNGNDNAISSCATFLSCSWVEGRAVSCLGLVTGLKTTGEKYSGKEIEGLSTQLQRWSPTNRMETQGF